MDKQYVKLFKELAQAVAVSAETVMEYNRQHDDKQGVETATIMRDDFQALAESIDNLGEDYLLNKEDIARLLVGSMVQTSQLQDRINSLKAAMTGYQTDVIPKLQEILDNAKDDEEAANMANEKFVIKKEE